LSMLLQAGAVRSLEHAASSRCCEISWACCFKQMLWDLLSMLLQGGAVRALEHAASSRCCEISWACCFKQVLWVLLSMLLQHHCLSPLLNFRFVTRHRWVQEGGDQWAFIVFWTRSALHSVSCLSLILSGY